MALLKAKAFYDKDVSTNNLITTITGIVLTMIQLVVSVLLATGKIDVSQMGPLSENLAAVVTAAGQIIGYVSAIILMFRATDA